MTDQRTIVRKGQGKQHFYSLIEYDFTQVKDGGL